MGGDQGGGRAADGRWCLGESPPDQDHDAVTCDEIAAVLEKSQRLIIIENNQSGQFARHLRAETGIVADGHIRKYDGEPFEPKHIVSAVHDIIGGQEVVDVLSTDPGFRTDQPTGTSGPWEGLKQVTRPGVPSKA